ncbi:DNA-binding ferritin-like protein (Dps family) [Nocardia amikacinitolerans]|uniref:DNA-binding ferritin-like protein (Dps family) n=1 Tax=Nocardia amikacinitolerans TaxID=756689 RepID=A0A285KNK4_9NOCA|nr:DUF1048 domain-containing protein [Nocardia amikacinitolerans]MCP2275363.1 DNA-binding ferritin-like protein (Dps family) [Nocardia amikacinitolerans]MCP2293604.1 DNA-binding ferritin-like protein (Dps family) [Nocardia amikacinitolerans]SNY74224.1 DNA-binding ferritin-like protein (Dps family) [Nocardia amikacinitolerans]
MNLWNTLTGKDITREYEALEARAAALPGEHHTAWQQIKAELSIYSDFTGRNLIPILDSVLELLEQTAADGQDVHEALGDDIPGFCAAITGAEGARNFRDKWRAQLNKNVAKKLNRLGE